jgi:hypothetical protein
LTRRDVRNAEFTEVGSSPEVTGVRRGRASVPHVLADELPTSHDVQKADVESRARGGRVNRRTYTEADVGCLMVDEAKGIADHVRSPD